MRREHAGNEPPHVMSCHVMSAGTNDGAMLSSWKEACEEAFGVCVCEHEREGPYGKGGVSRK